MVGLIFKQVVLPLLLWFPVAVLPAYVIPEQYASLRPLPALIYATALLYWWLTTFARWLVRRWRQVILGYLLTNLATALLLTSSLFMASLALDNYNKEISAVLGLLCLLVGPGWLIWSITHLIRYGQRRRKSLLWRLLADWLDDRDAQGNQAPPKKQKPAQQPKRTQPSLHQSAPATSSKALPPTPMPTPARTNQDRSPYTLIGHGEDAERDTSVAIPPRATTQRPNDGRPDLQSRQFQQSDRAISSWVVRDNDPQEFVRQGQQWTTRQERLANYVPFETYRPAYRQMSPEQQQWYFYWRTQVRQGNPLSTDLSYLFVYVYELINLVGVSSPAVAREQLIAFWQSYRVLHPKLDTYLVDWVADFTVLHNLSPSPLTWYAQVLAAGAINKRDETLLLEAWYQQGQDYTALPATFLYTLAGYATKQNKFYQAYQQELGLDDALKRGVEAIDAHLRQTEQRSLFELHMPPSTQTIVRPPFQSAVHIYPDTPIVIARVRPWLAEVALQEDLKAILRYSENILRAQVAYKAKLRGVTLAAPWAAILEQTFAKATPKPSLTIDLTDAAALHRESDELRQRLLAANEEATSKPATPVTASKQPSPANHSQDAARFSMEQITPDTTPSGAPYEQRPEDTPDGLLTDLPAIVAILGNPTSEATALLRSLRAHNWQSKPTQLQVAGESGFVSLLYDQINERAILELGDGILFMEGEEWVVAEDYRDEISYILDHPDFAVELASTATIPDQASPETPGLEQTERIPAGWEEFVRAMQPLHWATLATVLESSMLEPPVPEHRVIGQVEVTPKLEALARAHYATASQLLDQTNEVGLETIGDNLIDVAGPQPQVIDEYREPLKTLLVWAKQNDRIESLL